MKLESKEFFEFRTMSKFIGSALVVCKFIYQRGDVLSNLSLQVVKNKLFLVCQVLVNRVELLLDLGNVFDRRRNDVGVDVQSAELFVKLVNQVCNGGH